MAIRVSKAKQRSSDPRARSLAADTQSLLPLAWPLEHLLQLQAELLKAAEPNLNGWLNRRREGTNALLRACEKLAACRDFGEALSIQSELIDGAMNRLDLDVQAVTEHVRAVSQCTVGVTRQAAQTTTELATRGAEWVVRSVEADAESQESRDSVETSPPAARSGVAERPVANKAAA
jgi:hypothetical protein